MMKVLVMLKRHESLSTEEFRAHYETVHRRIGERYLTGRAIRYMRRFLDPLVDRVTGIAPEPEYDVITELWFKDAAAYAAARQRLLEPDAREEIAADEARLFDRARHRYYTVEESVSDGVVEGAASIA